MNENRVIPLHRKDEIDDPHNEILRSGEPDRYTFTPPQPPPATRRPPPDRE
jgi:hypothetical protein